MGDFSQAGVTVYRLDDTGSASCAPVPGNLVPGSLIDPAQKAAFNLMPSPNVPDSTGTGVGYWKRSGPITAGGRITITASSSLSMFGGFMQIPCANPFATKSDTLKLFVDGKLVASREVSYSLAHR